MRCAAGCLLAVGGSVAQEPVPPPSGSEAAALAPLPQDAPLVLRFRVVGRSEPLPTEPDEVLPPPTEFDDVITLGLDARRFYVESTAGRHVYDREARRVYQLAEDGRTYREQSFFWTPDYLTAELVDRIGASHLMGKVGVRDRAFDTFHMEALFRGRVPDSEVQVVPRQLDGGLVEFATGGEPVAGWLPSDEPVAEELRASFACFLSRKARLHPVIQGAVVASGTVPRVLEFRNYNLGLRLDARWDLVDVARGAVPEDGWLGAGERRAVREVISLEPLTQVMSLARGDRRPGAAEAQPVEARELQKQAAAAASAGRPLDAFLLQMEATLQSGVRPELGPRELFGDGGVDERTRGFLQAMEQSRGEEAAAAAAWFAEFGRAGLTRPHMVDLFASTAMARAGDLEGAEAALMAVLRANPWLAAAYKDLGDLLRRRLDMVRAWQCYDVGRELAPRHEIFEPVRALERELLADRPTFF